MQQVLRLKVLGGLSVNRDGTVLTGALAQPRRLAVLALLARAGHGGVPRERLLSTLWPDIDEERARHTLNQTLYAIRREVGNDEIIVGVRELRLNTDLLSNDLIDFQSAIAERDLQRAVDVYDGPFVDGFHLPGADEFERWVERERAALERTYANALEQLALDATARHDHARAVAWWRTRAARDPLDARVAIALMQSLDAAGDRRAAIQHARVYELLIDEELSLPPDREVVRFADALRREQVAASATTATAVADPPGPPMGVAVPEEPTERSTRAAEPAADAPPTTTAERRRITIVSVADPVVEPRRSALTPVGPKRSGGWPLHRRPAFLVAAAILGATALGTFVTRRGDAATEGRAPIPAAQLVVDTRRVDSATAYRMYEQGRRAHFRGDIAIARTFFEAAVGEDSLFALAQYYAAIDAGDRLEARRGLERARRLAARASDRERLTIMAGWAHEMSVPSLRAIAETLAVRYPAEAAGHVNLGIALVFEGRYLEALGPLRRAAEMDTLGLRDAAAGCGACDALRWMVSAYELADSLAAAERVARDWARRQPDSHVAVYALVEVLDIEGRGAEADSVLKARSWRVNEDANATRRRAWNLMRAGDFDSADRLLTDVLSAGGVSERVDAYWSLVISLRQQGRLAEALDATRRMRSLLPRAPTVGAGAAPSEAVLEAQVLLELGRPRAAAALFDSIARGHDELDSGPTAAGRAAWNLTHSAGARVAAGDTATLGRLIDSVRSLGAVSGSGRDTRLHHHVRGLMFAARHDDTRAVAELGQAILSRNFGYTRTNYELARALLRLGRPADAVSALQPALRGPMDAANLYVTRTELHELLAQAWDAASGRDSAAAHYRVVAAAWKRADPLLQARRARAQERVGALDAGR